VFHYTVKNVIGEGKWSLVCYACLPRVRSAGYDVKQHDGKKDDKCALCGLSILPPTHGERGLAPITGQSVS
jgi:hypothetical protein